MRPRAKITVTLFCAAATVVAAVSGGRGSDNAAPRRQTAADYPREMPGTPPGVPARSGPARSPATSFVYGSAKTFQVNVDAGQLNIIGDAANEPSIAVDPTNPQKMAIGWRQFDTFTSNFRQAGYAYTGNGGRGWTFPGVLEPGVFRSDPVLDFDAAGRFYYNSLKVVGNVFSCQVFESANGGGAWSAPVEAYGGDKQWMTVDRTGGPSDGHLYQYWSTAAGCCADTTFNRSVNGNGSWQHPVRIPATPVWGTLAVDSDGTLFLCGVSASNLSVFYVVKSTTAKDPLVTPTFAAAVPVYFNGALRVGGGTGAGDPNPGGLLGQVWIGVDRSGGPNDGYLYMVASIDPPGDDPLDVHFVRSTDGGQTWSFPVRVNDDPAGNRAWQWFATMSVSPNGRIDVAWNDTRNSSQANMSSLYYAHSDDGGATWSANERLSGQFNSHAGWPLQNKIGDYYDMVSDDVGANLAWAATFNNEQDVYYSRIGDYDCNTNGVPDSVDIATHQSTDFNDNGIPDECEGIQSAVAEAPPAPYRLYQNVPNPFNPSTVIRYEVPSGGARVTLAVFDVDGRRVRTLIDGFEGAGERTAVWDGRDARGRAVSSGVYFYRLEAPGFSATRKMVLLK